MITDAIIVGFQSHKDTRLSLLPGLNALKGDTDSGKSAVFRALMWLFTNRPTGEAFCSNWGGDTHVAVKKDETWIGRVRGTGKNYYYVGEDTPKNRLEGFGNGPPPEVVTGLLNLGEVNFQSQMSLPFLISLTSGKVGRFLNDASELDVIDRSTTAIASILKRERAELIGAETQLSEFEKGLKEFDWLDNAEIEILALTQNEKEVERLRIDQNELNSMLDEIFLLEDDLTQITPILSAESQIAKLSILQNDIILLQSQIKELDSLLDNIDENEFQREEAENILPAETEVKRLSQLLAEIDLSQKDSIELTGVLNDLRSSEYDLAISESKLNIMEEEFEKNFPQVCPLCGKINDHYVH